MTGDNCSANCATRDHETWGECQRAKNLRIAFCQDWKGLDATRQKKWDAELDAYQDAKRQGIQPDGTKMHQIQGAVDISNKVGEAYDQRKLGLQPLAALK